MMEYFHFRNITLCKLYLVLLQVFDLVVRFVRSASSRTLMVRILRISVRRTRILRTAVTIAVRIVVRTIAMISTKDTTTITTIIVSNTFTSGSHLHTSMYQKLFIQPH